MITVYWVEKGEWQSAIISQHTSPQRLQQALWIDLLNLSRDEEKFLATALGLSLPTRAAMLEIEVSSRLRHKDNLLMMTALMLANSETSEPTLDAVSFILENDRLITVRYLEFQTFVLFSALVKKQEVTTHDAAPFFLRFLETAIDRIADILERIGAAIEAQSQWVFRNPKKTQNTLNFRQTLQDIGANGDMCAKMRESLTTFNRLVSYFGQNKNAALGESGALSMTALCADMHALSDHVSFLSSQINFLLNATLGMINIHQSNTIKIFSIAAVIFLPPTLVATVYGMNFTFMPAFLYMRFGFPFGLITMLLSAILPYQFFKWKKWL